MRVIRYHYFNMDNININKLEILEGEYHSGDGEILVERETVSIKKYDVEDENNK